MVQHLAVVLELVVQLHHLVVEGVEYLIDLDPYRVRVCGELIHVLRKLIQLVLQFLVFIAEKVLEIHLFLLNKLLKLGFLLLYLFKEVFLVLLRHYALRVEREKYIILHGRNVC